MIRACMITPNMSLGGAERWLTDLIVHSPPDKLQWTGVAISGYGGADEGLIRELHRTGVPLICSDPGVHRPKHAKPFFREGIKIMGTDFLEVVKEAAQGADVLVTWGSPYMGGWLDWFTGPRVLVSHVTTTDKRQDIAITGVTHLAAVSRAADRYFNQFASNDLPRKIIYNGVQRERCLPSTTYDEARAKIREMWHISQEAVVVGCVGRQTKEKNFLAAARAVKALGENYYAVYYGIDGTAQKPDEGLRLWCKNNIPGRFHINTPVSNVGDVYAGLDALVLASQREACSLVLIEAWMAGVPVVATPVGSVPELEEEYGRLVTRVSIGASDVELGNAVKAAITDRTIRNNALKHSSAHMTVDNMVSSWVDYLTQLKNEHEYEQQKVNPSPIEVPHDGPNIGVIVMARGKSTRVPGKVLAKIGDRCVLDFTFDAVSAMRRRVHCAVLTESDEVEQVCQAANVTVLREIPSDTPGWRPQFLPAVKKLEELRGVSFDFVLWLNGDCPIRPEGVLDKVVDELDRTGADTVQTVVKVPTTYHPARQLLLNAAGSIVRWYAGDWEKNSQDFEPIYALVGAGYGIRRSLVEMIEFFGPHHETLKQRPVICKAEQVLEIDWPEDLEEARRRLNR